MVTFQWRLFQLQKLSGQPQLCHRLRNAMDGPFLLLLPPNLRSQITARSDAPTTAMGDCSGNLQPPENPAHTAPVLCVVLTFDFHCELFGHQFVFPFFLNLWVLGTLTAAVHWWVQKNTPSCSRVRGLAPERTPCLPSIFSCKHSLGNGTKNLKIVFT